MDVNKIEALQKQYEGVLKEVKSCRANIKRGQEMEANLYDILNHIDSKMSKLVLPSPPTPTYMENIG